MIEPTVTLKEFITEKFMALEKSTEAARAGMEKRLDGMNEFRDAVEKMMEAERNEMNERM